MSNPEQDDKILALFDKFNNIYEKYWENINKFTFIKIITEFYLNDFPKNLSEEIKAPIEYMINSFQGLVKMQHTVKTVDENTIEYEATKDEPEFNEKFNTYEFIFSLASFFDIDKSNGQDYLKLRDTISDELIETFNAQIIVMLYAYFDSFIGDCFYYVFKVKNEKWQTKNVPFTYNEFKEGLTEDDFIIKHIKQNLLKESTYDQVKSLLSNVNSNISEILDDADSNLLKESEQVRHIIVHNSGIVDVKFKQKIDTPLDIGDKFPISQEYSHKILFLIVGTMLNIFEKISLNLFNMNKIDRHKRRSN